MLVPATELQPFFDAILASPENDEPRLALSRYLLERGDMRGEHIRLSIEIDKLEQDDPARAALEELRTPLPSFAWFGKQPPSIPMGYRTRRGFIEEIECSVANFAIHGENLVRDAPIRIYDPLHLHGNGEQLAACPALAKLRCLKIKSFDVATRAAVLASPHLTELRELHLSTELPDRRSVVKLGWELRGLRGLRELVFIGGHIGPSAVTALGALARLKRLEHLGVRVDTPGLTKLRMILGEERVSPRPAPPFTFRFGVLDLSGGRVDVMKVIDSGKHRSASKLLLAWSRLGDRGLAHLARSGAFPALVELQLDDTGITDDGARVFAREAVGFERLEILSLGDVPRTISDSAIEELARSPRLPSLRRIVRSWEHRPYSDYSEGPVTTQLRGHDERVVESIVHHWTFP